MAEALNLLGRHVFVDAQPRRQLHFPGATGGSVATELRWTQVPSATGYYASCRVHRIYPLAKLRVNCVRQGQL
jgi:hypothetical protein